MIRLATLCAIVWLAYGKDNELLAEVVRDFNSDDFPAEYVIMTQVCSL